MQETVPEMYKKWATQTHHGRPSENYFSLLSHCPNSVSETSTGLNKAAVVWTEPAVQSRVQFWVQEWNKIEFGENCDHISTEVPNTSPPLDPHIQHSLCHTHTHLHKPLLWVFSPQHYSHSYFSLFGAACSQSWQLQPLEASEAAGGANRRHMCTCKRGSCLPAHSHMA